MLEAIEYLEVRVWDWYELMALSMIIFIFVKQRLHFLYLATIWQTHSVYFAVDSDC